jgi:HTH-type transcriptional regulator, sugar sensing transcriptional regulator
MTNIDQLNQLAIEKLMDIGFTQLESEIYMFLLREGQSTGYAVAKGVGKATANVYKSLETLASKGGVLKAQSESKAFAATPWVELIQRQKMAFNSTLQNLEDCFKQLPERQQDEQIYQITNVEQIITTAIQAIDDAKHFILADLEPGCIDLLKASLEAAAKRGVEVRIKTYADEQIEGVFCTVRKHGEIIYSGTDDLTFMLSVDGATMVKAMLTSDKKSVIQAFYTKSAFMTLTIHNALLYGMVLTELKQCIPKGDIKKAQQILNETEHLHPFSSRNHVFQNFKHRYEGLRN